MKVLIAIDGSEFSWGAIDHVLKRSWQSEDEFKIVTVIDQQPIKFRLEDSERSEDYEFDMLSACANLTDKARQRFRRKLSRNQVSTEILSGEADMQIINYAWEWPADLIIIGTHGHSDSRRFPEGSVAEFVTRMAPCRVEAIKETASVLCSPVHG